MKKNVEFSREKLIKEICREARALNLRSGSAEKFAVLTTDAVEKWFGSRTIVTEKDLKLRVAKELKKYNEDLSYIYLNRDKII